ncbi:MAG: hypothetical protein JNK11_16785 [Alphaproteobacteria bacterium]|nr:hypothetical protein [Alphaproteobacteria bacterium]
MTDATEAARWDDVETVARLLAAHAVEYILVGGYALFANGIVRLTQDIDIVVRVAPENSRRWIAALSRLPDGIAAGLAGEDDPFPRDEDTGALGVIRINDAFTVDVMPSACGLSYEQLLPYRDFLDYEDGLAVPVLNLEGLLLTKRGSRQKDMVDAEALRLAIARAKGKA